jgi:hypothetical protein
MSESGQGQDKTELRQALPLLGVQRKEALHHKIFQLRTAINGPEQVR